MLSKLIPLIIISGSNTIMIGQKKESIERIKAALKN
jgi:hypothetical protein